MDSSGKQLFSFAHVENAGGVIGRGGPGSGSREPDGATMHCGWWEINLGRDAVNHVISVSGTEGNPQPETWRVVLESPDGRGVREVEITDGQIVSISRAGAVVGSAEGATINTKQLNLDSSGAYSVASYTADKSHAHFYQSQLHVAHGRTWRSGLDSYSSKPFRPAGRHYPHRRQQRKRHSHGRHVCRRDHGRRRD